MLDFSIRLLMRLLLDPVVRRALRARLSLDERERVVRSVRRNYDALARDLPGEPTLGARIMVRLAGAVAELHGALRDAGLAGDEAMRTTAQITWPVYRRLTAPLWMLSRPLGRGRLARVRRVMDMLMRSVYRAPGYQMSYVRPQGGGVAFDVHRCPVAEYFAGRGLSQLCVASFCDLDFPLADRWGVGLQRTQTLAGGATHCDFRFRERRERAVGPPFALKADVDLPRSGRP